MSQTTIDNKLCLAELFDKDDSDWDDSFSVPSPYKTDYHTISSPYVSFQDFNSHIDKFVDPIIFMQLNIFSLPSKWDDFIRPTCTS